jgi:hypothetical protein
MNSCFNSPQEVEDNYYPLKIGNEWHYYDYYSFSFGTDSLILKVDSTTIRNGIEYFVLSTYTSSYYDLIGQSYMRYDEGKYYALIDSTEYLSLDFTIDINQPWITSSSNSTKTILLKDSTFSNEEILIEECIVYSNVTEMDSTISIFAKNIGMVYLKSYTINAAGIDDITYLIWARINDEKIVLK